MEQDPFIFHTNRKGVDCKDDKARCLFKCYYKKDIENSLKDQKTYWRRQLIITVSIIVMTILPTNYPSERPRLPAENFYRAFFYIRFA